MFAFITKVAPLLLVLSGNALATERVFSRQVPIPATTFGPQEMDLFVDVNMGIRYFLITTVSLDPWICQAQVWGASADGQGMPRNGAGFFPIDGHNIGQLDVDVFAVDSQEACVLQVEGFR
jgi:hypothetical protein